MFCSKCGNQINQGEKFCSKCGNAVLQKQVQYSVTKLNSTPVVQSITKQPISKKSKILIAGISVLLVIIIIASILLTNLVIPRVKIQKALDSCNYQQLQEVYDDYFKAWPNSITHTTSHLTEPPNIKQEIINEELMDFYEMVLIDIVNHQASYGEESREIIDDYLLKMYGNLIIDGTIQEPIYKGHTVYEDVEERYNKIVNVYCYGLDYLEG